MMAWQRQKREDQVVDTSKKDKGASVKTLEDLHAVQGIKKKKLKWEDAKKWRKTLLYREHLIFLVVSPA
jgi:hypothetical protein